MAEDDGLQLAMQDGVVSSRYFSKTDLTVLQSPVPFALDRLPGTSERE